MNKEIWRVYVLFILCIFSFYQTMAAWKKQGYHEQEEYASFKDLLQVPVDDAQDIIANRFPIPRYVETEQGGSQVHWH